MVVPSKKHASKAKKAKIRSLRQLREVLKNKLRRVTGNEAIQKKELKAFDRLISRRQFLKGTMKLSLFAGLVQTGLVPTAWGRVKPELHVDPKSVGLTAEEMASVQVPANFLQSGELFQDVTYATPPTIAMNNNVDLQDSSPLHTALEGFQPLPRIQSIPDIQGGGGCLEYSFADVGYHYGPTEFMQLAVDSNNTKLGCVEYYSHEEQAVDLSKGIGDQVYTAGQVCTQGFQKTTIENSKFKYGLTAHSSDSGNAIGGCTHAKTNQINVERGSVYGAWTVVLCGGASPSQTYVMVRARSVQIGQQGALQTSSSTDTGWQVIALLDLLKLGAEGDIQFPSDSMTTFSTYQDINGQTFIQITGWDYDNEQIEFYCIIYVGLDGTLHYFNCDTSQLQLSHGLVNITNVDNFSQNTQDSLSGVTFTLTSDSDVGSYHYCFNVTANGDPITVDGIACVGYSIDKSSLITTNNTSLYRPTLCTTTCQISLDCDTFVNISNSGNPPTTSGAGLWLYTNGGTSGSALKLTVFPNVFRFPETDDSFFSACSFSGGCSKYGRMFGNDLQRLFRFYVLGDSGLFVLRQQIQPDPNGGPYGTPITKTYTEGDVSVVAPDFTYATQGDGSYSKKGDQVILQPGQSTQPIPSSTPGMDSYVYSFDGQKFTIVAQSGTNQTVHVIGDGKHSGCELTMYDNGKVDIKNGNNIYWSSGVITSNAPAVFFMQADGNCVARDNQGRMIWSAGAGNPGVPCLAGNYEASHLGNDYLAAYTTQRYSHDSEYIYVNKDANDNPQAFIAYNKMVSTSWVEEQILQQTDGNTVEGNTASGQTSETFYHMEIKPVNTYGSPVVLSNTQVLEVRSQSPLKILCEHQQSYHLISRDTSALLRPNPNSGKLVLRVAAKSSLNCDFLVRIIDLSLMAFDNISFIHTYNAALDDDNAMVTTDWQVASSSTPTRERLIAQNDSVADSQDSNTYSGQYINAATMAQLVLPTDQKGINGKNGFGLQYNATYTGGNTPETNHALVAQLVQNIGTRLQYSTNQSLADSQAIDPLQYAPKIAMPDQSNLGDSSYNPAQNLTWRLDPNTKKLSFAVQSASQSTLVTTQLNSVFSAGRDLLHKIKHWADKSCLPPVFIHLVDDAVTVSNGVLNEAQNDLEAVNDAFDSTLRLIYKDTVGLVKEFIKILELLFLFFEDLIANYNNFKAAGSKYITQEIYQEIFKSIDNSPITSEIVSDAFDAMQLLNGQLPIGDLPCGPNLGTSDSGSSIFSNHIFNKIIAFATSTMQSPGLTAPPENDQLSDVMQNIGQQSTTDINNMSDLSTNMTNTTNDIPSYANSSNGNFAAAQQHSDSISNVSNIFHNSIAATPNFSTDLQEYMLAIMDSPCITWEIVLNLMPGLAQQFSLLKKLTGIDLLSLISGSSADYGIAYIDFTAFIAAFSYTIISFIKTGKPQVINLNAPTTKGFNLTSDPLWQQDSVYTTTIIGIREVEDILWIFQGTGKTTIPMIVMIRSVIKISRTIYEVIVDTAKYQPMLENGNISDSYRSWIYCHLFLKYNDPIIKTYRLLAYSKWQAAGGSDNPANIFKKEYDEFKCCNVTREAIDFICNIIYITCIQPPNWSNKDDVSTFCFHLAGMFGELSTLGGFILDLVMKDDANPEDVDSARFELILVLYACRTILLVLGWAEDKT